MILLGAAVGAGVYFLTKKKPAAVASVSPALPSTNGVVSPQLIAQVLAQQPKQVEVAIMNGFGTINIPSGVWAPASIPTVHRAPTAVTFTPELASQLQNIMQLQPKPVQVSVMGQQPMQVMMTTGQQQPPATDSGYNVPGYDIPAEVPGGGVPGGGGGAPSGGGCPGINGQPGGPYTPADLAAICAANNGVLGADGSCQLGATKYFLGAGGCLTSAGAGAGGGALSSPVVLGAAALAALLLLR